MASDYSCCPICMEGYDLDRILPKSLDCRHSLCKTCLMSDGKPLKQCPSCRQPINNPENAVNDLTMIDYLERKRQKRREREQRDRKTKLIALLETVSQELLRTEADLDERKHSNLELAKEKLDVFASHAKCVLKETLIHQSENEEVVSKMASINIGELNDKIQLLREHRALVTSLLEQPYINQDDFEERESEIQRIIQSDTSPLEDDRENLWSIYRGFLLDQFVKASKRGPSTDTKYQLGSTRSTSYPLPFLYLTF